ncbi:Chitin synthase A [Penicillium taxi]|uniref:Chitin synthase A n=1 Tax=Penicillium taxi TaxID=168475 RepID=UPI002544D5B9|nr:Chitin synthase A [Penicillium taxi]KAJ5895391.1 Chitin synthase A [Penicillium taxi]
MSRYQPSSYGEPPSYPDEANPFLSEQDSPIHNGASMRLLPTGSDLDDDYGGNPRGPPHYQPAAYDSPYVFPLM